VSRLELMVEPKASEVRRVELITGTGRRRRFSDDERARILEETLRPGVVVSEIARQHGLTPQQLFTWRRAARRRAASCDGRTEAPFVPAIVDGPAALPKIGAEVQNRAEDDATPLVGFDIGGASVWVCRGAEIELVTAIIRALKATR
jgi:transposase